MTSVINQIVKLSPYPELLIRRLYWSPTWHGRLVALQKHLPSHNTLNKNINEKYVPEIMDKIRMYTRISNGDLLLVHSSMEGMGIRSIFGLEAVLTGLKGMVGELGTIAMPTFPKYKYPCSIEEIVAREHTGSDFSDIMLTYDYLKKSCWTGALNKYFLFQPGVVRSKFPNNPLAAYGPLAEAMMEHNLDNDLPHGKGSSWEFCITHHARILFLGLPADHCCTIIHAAEDLLDTAWPVRDWYKKQKYRIIDKNTTQDIVIRERKLLWARYAADKYSMEKLRRIGLLHSYQVAGCTVEVINDAYELFQYLKRCALQNKPFYFHVPKNYLREPREINEKYD